jgi:hypothetical protein
MRNTLTIIWHVITWLPKQIYRIASWFWRGHPIVAGIKIGLPIVAFIHFLVVLGEENLKAIETTVKPANIKTREGYLIKPDLGDYPTFTDPVVSKYRVVKEKHEKFNKNKNEYDYRDDLTKIVNGLRYVNITIAAEQRYELQKKFNLPPGIVMAYVLKESGGNRFAISKAGAEGLTQFMPDTWRDFGMSSKDVNDPVANIDACARYIAYLASQDPSLESIVKGYLGSEGVKYLEELRYYVKVINDTEFLEDLERKFNKQQKNFEVNGKRIKNGEEFRALMQAYMLESQRCGLNKYRKLPEMVGVNMKEDRLNLYLLFLLLIFHKCSESGFEYYCM